jgi:hypothetical protein
MFYEHFKTYFQSLAKVHWSLTFTQDTCNNLIPFKEWACQCCVEWTFQLKGSVLSGFTNKSQEKHKTDLLFCISARWSPQTNDSVNGGNLDMLVLNVRPIIKTLVACRFTYRLLWLNPSTKQRKFNEKVYSSTFNLQCHNHLASKSSKFLSSFKSC